MSISCNEFTSTIVTCQTYTYLHLGLIAHINILTLFRPGFFWLPRTEGGGGGGFGFGGPTPVTLQQLIV